MSSYQVFDDVVVFRSASATSGWTDGTLQDAVNAAQSAGRPLFIDAGIYTVGNVSITDKLEMYAAPGNVSLRLDDGANSIISVVDAAHTYIHGIIFNGLNLTMPDGSALLTVSADVANNVCVIEQCQFRSSSQSGISFEGMGGCIDECMFINCSTAIFANNSSGLSIRSNTLERCGNNGILVWRDTSGFDGTVVDGNSITNVDADSGGTGPYGNAINIYRANNVVVCNNTINDCEFSAVRANVCSNVTITGNSCYNLRETALYFENTSTPTPPPVFGAVISNNIVEGCAIGVSITNFSAGARTASCVGNVIRTCTTRDDPNDPAPGIGITVEGDTVVSGNVVDDAEVYGIHLGKGTFTENLVCSNNIITNFSSTITTQAGIAVAGETDDGYQIVSSNMVQMKDTPGIPYALVALDDSGNIIMSGGAPLPVTTANFPLVTVSANSLQKQKPPS